MKISCLDVCCCDCRFFRSSLLLDPSPLSTTLLGCDKEMVFSRTKATLWFLHSGLVAHEHTLSNKLTITV